MGKKKLTNKLPSTTGDKRSDSRATVEARPPSPQPSQPAPTPLIPAMVPLDALAAYLRQQDPNRDWAATMAGFSQTGGMPEIPTPNPEIPTTVSPPTTTQTSSTPISEKPSPIKTALSASSNPSPIHQQIEPLYVIPLSAYQQIKEEEKEGEENESAKGENKSEETLITNLLTQEKEREEIDLNETARKQGLMTDDEFQSFLDGVNRMGIDIDEMAEGLDLASQSVEEMDEKQTEEGAAPQSVEEVEDEQGKAGATHQSVEEVEGKQIEEERPKSATP